MRYNRETAVNYALTHATIPNPQYLYFDGDDCTNFISQCLSAGGAKNHYHPTHPWWYVNSRWSISWAVAGSLYWYIRVCSEENTSGIRAKTFFQSTEEPLRNEILDTIKLGDLIQYVDENEKIRHSTIITSFQILDGCLEPLVSQHTYNAANVPWCKPFPKAIFHHITDIN